MYTCAHIPPPCAQQSPLETAVLVQPSPLQFLPPPWDQQTPRDLARLSQPSIVHLVEPPAIERHREMEGMRMRTAGQRLYICVVGRTVLPADAEVLGAARAAQDGASLAALHTQTSKQVCEAQSWMGAHTYTNQHTTRANKQTRGEIRDMNA